MTTITKTLAAWAFAPLLAACTLFPLAVHPASAESLKSENKDRDAEVAAQRGMLRPPVRASDHVGSRQSAPDKALRIRRDTRASYDSRQDNFSYFAQSYPHQQFNGNYATYYNSYYGPDWGVEARFDGLSSTVDDERGRRRVACADLLHAALSSDGIYQMPNGEVYFCP